MLFFFIINQDFFDFSFKEIVPELRKGIIYKIVRSFNEFLTNNFQRALKNIAHNETRYYLKY